MSKPILTIDATYAFDAAEDRAFIFTYSGGQLKSNTLVIKNNQTNAVVYNGTQTTMLLKHKVPANTLSNGTLYNVSVKVTETNGNVSEISNSLLFYCYSAPIFKMNISEGQIITNASFSTEITYSQAEGEQLQSYYVVLYDTQHQEIYRSSVRYDTTLPVMLNSLEDNKSYLVRAFGETLNHMELDTGYITVAVKYITPSMYSYLVAENDSRNGVIVLTSNITSIEGHTVDGSDPVYIDGCIDTKNGASIVFDQDFMIKSDFSFNLIKKRCGQNKINIGFSNGTQSMIITERVGNFDTDNNEETIFYELRLDYLSSTEIVYSNRIQTPSDDQFLSLWVKRKDNLFDLTLEIYVKPITEDGGEVE